MKIVTILGTRPEIIRLSRIIPRLDALCDHVLVHTGQNYDERLSDVFFDELGLRAPDHYLGIRASTFAEQIGQVIAQSEQVLLAEKPSRVLILGDTNSALSAITAKRLGIPVYHMEAGNRCYDDRVPEEVNRRVVDHCSDVLMPYTERSRQNLLREGISAADIYVIGNPIYEVIQHYRAKIEQSGALDDLSLDAQCYFLVTMHRAENVDVESRTASMVAALKRLRDEYSLPVIVSTHPRTQSRLEVYGITGMDSEVRFLPPFGFPDFVALEQSAKCVLTDSGTVQEECSILGVPNVTLRDVTERPETLECGSNMLAGVDPEFVLRCVRTVLAGEPMWSPPAEYVTAQVSNTVVRLVLGHRDTRRAIGLGPAS